MKLCSRGRAIRGVWVVLSFVATAGAASGQHAQNTAATSTKGSLSGRVFAITKGGDLKPARMADVYILFSSGVTRDGKAVDSGETAELVFTEELLQARELYNKELEANIKELEANNTWTEKMVCLKDLATFSPPMLKAMEWAEAHKKQYQIVKTQTDEDGNFSASLPAGIYHVLVRGRAGFSESLWDLDFVILQPGSHLELKLSSPKTACLDISD